MSLDWLEKNVRDIRSAGSCALARIGLEDVREKMAGDARQHLRIFTAGTSFFRAFLSRHGRAWQRATNSEWLSGGMTEGFPEYAKA